MTPTDPWRNWPALAEIGTARRWRLPCAHGVWGKEPGSENDFRWIGASSDFADDSRGRALAAYLGNEDDPAPLLLWSSSAEGIHQAAHCYPSRFTDSANRRFLERQYLEWRNPRRLPSALAALAMLPRAGELDDSAWRSQIPAPSSVRSPHDGIRELERSSANLDDAALAQSIADGSRDLMERVLPDALAAMYPRLLAGNRLIELPETRAPLTPCAFAVLLLPLERQLADRLSMVSRLPSRRIDPKRFAAGDERFAIPWHLLGRGSCAPELLSAQSYTPSEEHRRIGSAMAQAVLGNDPGALAGSPRAARSWQGSPPERRPGARELRIWGAASAGKTAYLAHLFTKLDHGGDPDWSVRLPPGADQGWFKSRLDLFQKQNRFPEPTTLGTINQLAYRLANQRTGQSVIVAIEDRPGKDFVEFNQEMARRLANADGILLLLDPMRSPALQNEEIRRTFLAMQQERRDAGRDPRPLAICVSKCDEYIRSVADYREATCKPEVFLRERIGKTVADAIVYYFANYRFFALSAAGLHIEHGAIRPSVFYDETFETRIASHGRPINLLEPLVWLIESLGS